MDQIIYCYLLLLSIAKIIVKDMEKGLILFNFDLFFLTYSFESKL